MRWRPSLGPAEPAHSQIEIDKAEGVARSWLDLLTKMWFRSISF